MKELIFDDEKIVIVEKKKKLFSSEIKETATTIRIQDIKYVSQEIYQEKLNSSTIEYGNNNEEFISVDSLENPECLSELIRFLKRNNVKVERVKLN